MTLKIERATRQRFTVFTLSGRMEAAQVPELEELFDRDYRNIILDLRDVRLADRDAVNRRGPHHEQFLPLPVSSCRECEKP